MVIPQPMRRAPAPWPPFLGELDHLFGRRPPLQAESETRCLLQGKIPCRPSIGMTETEQQINVCCPRADAVQPGKHGMRVVGVEERKRIEVDLAFGDRRADRLDGLDLRTGEPNSRELVVA